MPIKMLNEATINKIAAGEVILGPISVVKELVENSIDSGASYIQVEIENGGKKTIIIKDDGCGITFNEVPLAFSRYATSKISKVEELTQITTLGFRGEALSSLIAVAKVRVLTRDATEEVGSETIFEDGNMISQRVVNHSKGTMIFIEDLFKNLPARKKHMNKDSTEALKIQELMEKLAISHVNIRFSFKSNSKLVFQTVGDGSLKNVLSIIYGRNFVKNLISLDYTNEPMELKGYIGNINLMKNTKTDQLLFINGRYVRMPKLFSAFEEAYEGYIMQHKHPVGIIFLNLPPKMLDINIHPSKTNIAILNESLIKILFRQGIRQALTSSDLSINLGETNNDSQESRKQIIEDKTQQTIENYLDYTDSLKNIIEQKKDIPISDVPYEETKEIPVKQNKLMESNEVYSKPSINFSKKKTLNLSHAKIIGQLFSTYILLERGEDIVLIDQHAAHEARRYEELKLIHGDKRTVPIQILLNSIPLTTSKLNISRFNETSNILKKFGYDCEVFGNDSILVRSVPMILGEPQDPHGVIEFLENNYSENKLGGEELMERIILMSCKSAIKGNQHLTNDEILELMKKIEDLENPFTCPHGRPIILHLTKYELEKLFRRVVS